MNKVRKNKKGFTLAELLIVVAIVAVLTAIAVPAFSGALANARNATYEANARSVHAEAMSQYLYAENQTGKFEFVATYNTITYTWTYDSTQKDSNGATKATVAVGASDADPASYSFTVTSGATIQPGT